MSKKAQHFRRLSQQRELRTERALNIISDYKILSIYWNEKVRELEDEVDDRQFLEQDLMELADDE